MDDEAARRRANIERIRREVEEFKFRVTSGEMSDEEKLRMIENCVRNAVHNENGGDWEETWQTILWLVTNGAEGQSWGCYHEPSREGD